MQRANTSGAWKWGFVAIVMAVSLIVMRQRGAGAAAESPEPASPPHVVASDPVQAGRYIIMIAGCNDCHTPGFMEKGMEVPEEQWLTGLPLGWRGPWGTTYGANLRATVEVLNEEGFIKTMRARKSRPPHPWPSMHAMSDADLRAVYRYIKSLEPVGDPMPSYVPPNQEPKTPYFLLDPDMAAKAAQVAARPGLN